MTEEIKIKEFVGLESLRAFRAFHTLLLGMKMTPDNLAKSYEEFLKEIFEKNDEDKKNIITQALGFIEISESELESLIFLTYDTNNILIDKSTIKNLKIEDIVNRIVAVCLKFFQIDIFMINADLKKN